LASAIVDRVPRIAPQMVTDYDAGGCSDLHTDAVRSLVNDASIQPQRDDDESAVALVFR
jgi:hypothetical protein